MVTTNQINNISHLIHNQMPQNGLCLRKHNRFLPCNSLKRELLARSGQELIIQQGTVDFVPGPVSATVSLVTADPISAPANGQTPITVTVSAYDANNNPIPGADVSVSVNSSGSAVISPLSAITNDQGRATVQVTDTTGEDLTASAIVDDVPLNDTAAMSFLVGDLSLSMTAPESAVANSTMNYSIMIQQSNGMSAENVTLQLQLPAGVTYISQNSPITPTQSGQTLTWNLETFASGQTLSFDVSGHISASAVVDTVLSAQANVTSSSPEANLANYSG